MNQCYTIKPLKWTGSVKDEFGSCRADAPGGFYVTRQSKESGFGLRWGYCFDEYYDEDEQPCGSLKEGKALCDAEYRRRLLACLVPCPCHTPTKKENSDERE